jgi:hypothetical protein
MLKRISFLFVVLLIFGSMARASDPTLWGTVTAIDRATLHVRTDGGETAAVKVTADTQYRKWIMAKPWAQDPHADARFVSVGNRVGIDLADGDGRTARVVWIVVR